MTRTTTRTILTFALLILLMFAVGCDSSASQSEESVDSDPTESAATVPSGSWAYQIQDHTTDESLEALGDSSYEILVIDQQRSVVGDEDYDDAAVVEMLHESATTAGRERTVLCYIDVGEAESYRWYWQDDWEVGDPAWIVAPDPDGWDENYPVAFWDDEWRGIMFEALDGIIADGYDGIYLDWLEAYSFDPVVDMAESEGLDSEDELVAFVQDLANHARAQDPDFILIAQNAAEMGSRDDYREVFDGIAQEAVWFDGGGDPDAEEQVGDVPTDSELTEEYLAALSVWQDAGVPVWVCEYATESDNVETAYDLGAEHGFLTYVTTRPLDRLTQTPPP